MADITDLPVMTMTDARSIGFAGFNDVPHKAIDIPDGPFTITTKTSEGRRTTFCFQGKTYDAPARFIDVQFHDRGTDIPTASGHRAPTFNAFSIAGDGRHVTDSRSLPEEAKPSILVVLMDRQDEERSVRAFSADFHEADVPLAELLGRAAAAITARIGESREDLTQLVAELRAESARRASAF